MTIKHKFHTWYRFPAIQVAKKDTFYCKNPSCYKKVQLHQLHHKIAQCTICNSSFIVDVNTITPEMISVNCPACLGVQPDRETQLLESIKSEAATFLGENFDRLQVQLANRELELNKIEAKLNAREEKLEHQRRKHFDILKSHREGYKRRRSELLKLKHKIEQREANLKHLETTNAIDQDVMADAILTLFKQQETKNESHGLGEIER